jgi:hypothetical protein
MRALPAILLASLLLLCGCARPSLEGTWVLESRDLPDGSVQRPPAVLGCLSFADGRRNFNVHWKDAQGRAISIGSIAEYALADGEYRETNIYYRVSGLGGEEQYDLSRQTGVAPVTQRDGRLEFVLPLHGEPAVVFQADRLTATRQGEFVDHWRRVD